MTDDKRISGTTPISFPPFLPTPHFLFLLALLPSPTPIPPHPAVHIQVTASTRLRSLLGRFRTLRSLDFSRILQDFFGISSDDRFPIRFDSTRPRPAAAARLRALHLARGGLFPAPMAGTSAVPTRAPVVSPSALIRRPVAPT